MCRLGMEEMIEAQQSNEQEAATKDVECEVCGRNLGEKVTRRDTNVWRREGSQ